MGKNKNNSNSAAKEAQKKAQKEQEHKQMNLRSSAQGNEDVIVVLEEEQVTTTPVAEKATTPAAEKATMPVPMSEEATVESHVIENNTEDTMSTITMSEGISSVNVNSNPTVFMLQHLVAMQRDYEMKSRRAMQEAMSAADRRRKEDREEAEQRRKEFELRLKQDRDEAERRRLEAEQRAKMEREEFIKIIRDLKADAVTDTTPTYVTRAVEGTGHSRPPDTLAKTARPPEKIKVDMNLSDFIEWRRQWENYCELVKLNAFSEREQLAALKGQFTLEFSKLYNESIESKETTSLEETLNDIQSFLRTSRNIMVDMYTFTQCKQQAGQAFEAFHVKLKGYGKSAGLDTCKSCFEKLMVSHITAGVRDEEIRKKLLEMNPFPSLKEVLDKCRSYENVNSNKKEYDSSATAAYVGKNKKGKNSDDRKSRGQSKTREKRNERSKSRFPKAKDGICTACTKPEHKGGESCPAKGVECYECGGQDHYGKACFRRKKKQMDDGKDKKAGTARVAAARSEDWDRKADITLKVADKVTTLSGCPDTGAEITIMPTGMLDKIGMKLSMLDQSELRITAYDGRTTRPRGQFDGILTCKDTGHEVEDTIYVQDNAPDFLISGSTSEKLGIVTFPLYDDVKHRNAFFIAEGSPGEESIKNLKSSLLREFADVFSKHEIKPMKGAPMKIHLKKNAIPYALTAPRTHPFPIRAPIKAELKRMEENGIIERLGDEPTTWCHGMMPVMKPNGGIRICVDYTKINPYIERAAYPMRSPKDAVDAINHKDAWFTTLDATAGYWQLELDKEARDLTTFITTEGRYRFLRAPMGLNATGDEYNRRGDLAISNLNDVEKVVDDLLVHSQTYDEHIKAVRRLLQRCREHSITLNPEKFLFAQQQVKFVGYNVSSDGISADDKKIRAILDFPQPKNVTDLRGFNGLVNQLGQFSTEVAKCAEPLRPLLKKSNKFMWTTDHTFAFEAVKKALCKPPVLKPFDIKAKTFLMTDASRTKGLGFVLMQQDKEGKMHLVQCGSRFLTETETRYAMVELELVGVVWAVEKCRLYLFGLPEFIVVTDHKPLVPILNYKTLDQLEHNPRLLRLRERLLQYSFEAEWKKGAEHYAPDALSRAPIAQPDEDDVRAQERLDALCARVFYVHTNLDDVIIDNTYDVNVDNMAKAAKLDRVYGELVNLIKTGFPAKSNDLSVELKQFFKLQDELSVEPDGLVLYRGRIVVPQDQRRKILQHLHGSHQGERRTKQRARETVFWPGMTSDITNTIACCKPCQEGRASLPAEPETVDPKPTRPFQETAADLFEYAGYHYLIYVDRYSGWSEVNKYNKCPTADAVIGSLKYYFAQTGIPTKFRSDGGTQFTAEATKTFMRNWGVNHVFSAPHFPSSNGLAEASVKSIKALVTAATPDGNGDIKSDSFLQGLLELRNTPRKDGPSPAQMIFGRPMRTLVPAHESMYARDWQALMSKQDEILRTPKGLTKRPLRSLAVGQAVWLQHPVNKKWDKFGTIVQTSGRNYHVKLPSGRILWRNRKHLRAYQAGDEICMLPNVTEKKIPAERDKKMPRRVTFQEEIKVEPRRSNRNRTPRSM